MGKRKYGHLANLSGFTNITNGNEAAWASKIYRGHRTIPESILSDLEKAGIH
jgi:hypothetical protein